MILLCKSAEGLRFYIEANKLICQNFRDAFRRNKITVSWKMFILLSPTETTEVPVFSGPLIPSILTPPGKYGESQVMALQRSDIWALGNQIGKSL